jgi:hypothetical protein
MQGEAAMGKTDRPWDGTDVETQDTEGHDIRAQYPIPPNVDGDRGPDSWGITDTDDERDTEGHIQFRRRPGEAGE